jgi:hypothetical protein
MLPGSAEHALVSVAHPLTTQQTTANLLSAGARVEVKNAPYDIRATSDSDARNDDDGCERRRPTRITLAAARGR